MNSQVDFANPKVNSEFCVTIFLNQSETVLLAGLFVNFLCKQSDWLKVKKNEFIVGSDEQLIKIFFLIDD